MASPRAAALLCALLVVAAAPAARAGIFPSFPSLVPTGARDATNKACACIDGGMGSPECASGVSSYCEGQTGAAAAACAAANRFFGQKSTPDAPAAAGLLSTACAVAVPEKANACACLEVRVRCVFGSPGRWFLPLLLCIHHASPALRLGFLLATPAGRSSRAMPFTSLPHLFSRSLPNT